MTEKPRFSTFFDGRAGHFITDETERGRIMAHSFSEQDADFIVTKLNEPLTGVDCRPVFATALAQFREHLERDNGGPLTGDPQLALLLDDLCNFLEFNTGEKALTLGPSLLVYLSFISDTPTDSTLPAQDLAMQDSGESVGVDR